VIYGEYDEFFEKIVEDIEGKLQDGRATLIVFADKPKMDRFSAAIGKRNPDHPEYASALELKDGLDLDVRTTIVIQVLLPFWMITMLLAVASLYVLMLESKIGHTSTQSHPDDTCLWTRHGFRLPRVWASEEWWCARHHDVFAGRRVRKQANRGPYLPSGRSWLCTQDLVRSRPRKGVRH